MMRIGYLVDGLLLRSAPGRWVRSDQGTENQKPRIVLAPIFFFLVGDSDMWYLFWDIVVKVPCLAQLPHPVAFCEFEFLSFSCLVLFGLGFVFRFCIVPTFCCFTDPCLALFPLFRYAERCFSCQQTVVRWVVVKTCPMESHRG